MLITKKTFNFRSIFWILAYFAVWENLGKFLILSECIFMIGHVVGMKQLNVVWIIFEANFNFAPNDRRTSLSLEYTSGRQKLQYSIESNMLCPRHRSHSCWERALTHEHTTRKLPQSNFTAFEKSLGSLQYAANTKPDLSVLLSCCATRRDLLDANRLLAMPKKLYGCYSFNFQY